MRDVLGADIADNLISCSQDQEQEALKQAYRAMMTASEDKVTKCLTDVLNRVSTAGKHIMHTKNFEKMAANIILQMKQPEVLVMLTCSRTFTPTFLVTLVVLVCISCRITKWPLEKLPSCQQT
jgi:hypothetical protein